MLSFLMNKFSGNGDVNCTEIKITFFSVLRSYASVI